MSRWGKCNFKELKNLEKRLEQLDKADLDQFCRQMANDLAGHLLNKVIKRTVPGQIPPYATEEAKAKYWSGYTGGNLRDNWSVLPIEKKGNDYIITVINNAQYASYVEYGHRQTPGHYVPALGLRLKKSWVPGRYMLTISTQELQQQAPKLIEQKLYQFLRPIFENG